MFTLDHDISKTENRLDKAEHDSLSPLKILIIDKNRDFVVFFRMILNYMGFRAFGACSGENGIALARSIQPDVVFCDTDLPDMSGSEVSELIRRHCPAYMIALSDRAVEADQDEACFDFYVTKPIRTSVLDIIFRNILASAGTY
jgi:DNA-binding response OmpR family regulator